jgi:hypothetical protein
MHIKKLTNSNVLKRSESLIVLKCSKRYHDDVLIDLRKSIGTRFVQVYRHRHEPEPWVRGWKNGRCFRHPRTTNERRANTTSEILEDQGIAFKIRPKRGWHRLPTTYDDIFLRYHRTWKEHRRTRCKNADGINRRIHSPPFWDRVKQRVNFRLEDSRMRGESWLPKVITPHTRPGQIFQEDRPRTHLKQ